MINKKGFTLAKILIALVVVGAIASIAVPSMVSDVRQAHFKTAYKKAYSEAVSTAMAMKIKRTLASTNTSEDTMKYFEALKFISKNY